MDSESKLFFQVMGDSDRVRSARLNGVRNVLVVLSSRGMVFDMEALRQKILIAYPEAAVFFRTTDGTPIGSDAPEKVDLLIDLTGPGQRQPWCYSRKLRRMARFAVGRNAGFFRKKLYDRVYDEKKNVSQLPTETLQRERFVQKHVLALAGVAFVQAGDSAPDRGKITPLELPPFARL